jgi:hypothetical protein
MVLTEARKPPKRSPTMVAIRGIRPDLVCRFIEAISMRCRTRSGRSAALDARAPTGWRRCRVTRSFGWRRLGGVRCS